MHMSSDLRILTSRANGAKSRGPKTPEGKLASSRNAERHGMFSRCILIKGESPERFSQLLTELEDELQPQTGIETSLVESIAYCRWRQARLWAMETAGVNHEIQKQMPDGVDNPTRAALAIRSLTDSSRWLEFMSRYESRLERQISRSMRRFLELRARRS